MSYHCRNLRSLIFTMAFVCRLHTQVAFIVKSSAAGHLSDGQLLGCWAHCDTALLAGTTCAGAIQLSEDMEAGGKRRKELASYFPGGASLEGCR